MELRAALNAKPCDDRTCTDRDHWAPRGPHQCDPGCTRPSLHDGDCIAAADPLDEDDHRPRHNRDGGHVYRHGPNHWHDYGLEDGRCDMEPAGDDPVRLSDFPGPLTFCDCDDAPTIEAENGATD